MLTNPELCGIISSCSRENTEKTKFGNNLFINGGIAQLARAIGSYPIGRGFKSNFRYQHKADAVYNEICLMIRPVGQAVKTPPFHGGNSSSILLRVTNKKTSEPQFGCFFIQAAGLAWNHASACMESPLAHGITEGVSPAA